MRKWRVDEVMTREVVRVTAETGYQQIADLLVMHRVSAVPVVDGDGRVLGVVSEADLLPKLTHPDPVEPHPLVSRRRRDTLRKAGGDTAAQLMTSPATVVAAEVTVAEAARLMDTARVKRLPVVDADGRLVGIVSRRDLVRLYSRPDEAIRGDVVDLITNGLWIDPQIVDVEVSAGVVTLSGLVDRASTAHILVHAAHAVPGVVDVVDHLTGKIDDTNAVRSSWYRSHALSADERDIAGLA
jgi:CBS-domain-containing membrane protein